MAAFPVCVFFPVCVCASPSLYKDASHDSGFTNSIETYLNLTISEKTLFSNKVTFTDTRGYDLNTALWGAQSSLLFYYPLAKATHTVKLWWASSQKEPFSG